VMLRMKEENRDRTLSAAGVAALHILLGYAFLTGLGFAPLKSAGSELKLFDPFEEPPPPPAVPARPDKAKEARKAKPKDPEGAASPANLRNTPSEIVAPPPVVRLEVPPPVIAAPAAGQGSAAAAGAANVPGPGTGSGGQGTGLGSGSRGSGTGGGGGGGGRATRARWLSGSIRDSDYPRAAYEARIGGTVFLRFVVAPDGRVRDCVVTRSSGHAALDATTCRLITTRFRYRPARDAGGRAVAETIRGQHDWEVGPEPPPIEVEPDIVD
jgi:periplasmic protein TonB